ncbi:transglycosylase SLT domain-containing protein [Pseudoalteromonas peptidolytica]|uniref:Transglycosylase SLT domain-containing protein n=1 Tax=Pseudoalteromonas peptidolytica F12-50-A1 TaxID=1315280 RepID=A0A8I0MZP8_9GAMM|nr:transglycosylase SLT domain-containing protein [Pseudoalteromonas peptidolytica]MBE0348268.1 hypothetical protein [Pseudoalteromonas peptidolytica F12-50-A1]GEK08924.1 hypothetical protein PPE03_11730 [Pseudoalteromonas peptidolytica]
MKRNIFQLLCFMALTLSQLLVCSVALSADWDEKIEKAVKRYSPGRDPDLMKAQLWQESRYKLNAVSPVGASGIAQFMPATWEEQMRKLGLSGSPFDADLAIITAAFYMEQHYRFWSSPRPEWDRENLALCNYNAGAGNCLKAQKLSGGESLYPHIIRFLPEVTGHHSRETIEYVDRIRQFQMQIKVGLCCD